jgi:hypothetical protein
MGVGGDAPFLVYCGFLLPVVPPCFLAHSHSLPDAQEGVGRGKKGQYSGLSKSVVQCLLFTPPPHSFSRTTLHYTLQRRSDLCIPRNETARPRSFIPGNICFEFSVQYLCSAGTVT